MSDPVKYRKREEVDKVREETDPIKLLEARLIERGILDEAEAKEQREDSTTNEAFPSLVGRQLKKDGVGTEDALFSKLSTKVGHRVIGDDE